MSDTVTGKNVLHIICSEKFNFDSNIVFVDDALQDDFWYVFYLQSNPELLLRGICEMMKLAFS